MTTQVMIVLELDNYESKQDVYTHLKDLIDDDTLDYTITKPQYICVTEPEIQDIGDLCTSCHRSTAFGTGLYVNRVPSMSDDESGYMCAELSLIHI